MSDAGMGRHGDMGMGSAHTGMRRSGKEEMRISQSEDRITEEKENERDFFNKITYN